MKTSSLKIFNDPEKLLMEYLTTDLIDSKEGIRDTIKSKSFEMDYDEAKSWFDEIIKLDNIELELIYCFIMKRMLQLNPKAFYYIFDNIKFDFYFTDLLNSYSRVEKMIKYGYSIDWLIDKGYTISVGTVFNIIFHEKGSDGIKKFEKSFNRFLNLLESSNHDFIKLQMTQIYEWVYCNQYDTESIKLPITVYKKCLNDVIVEAIIPEDAIVMGGVGGKYRANKAIITKVYGETFGENVGVSLYNKTICYAPGEEVFVNNFDKDSMEWSTGFHFFLTREEAENYNF